MKVLPNYTATDAAIWYYLHLSIDLIDAQKDVLLHVLLFSSYLTVYLNNWYFLLVISLFRGCSNIISRLGEGGGGSENPPKKVSILGWKKKKKCENGRGEGVWKSPKKVWDDILWSPSGTSGIYLVANCRQLHTCYLSCYINLALVYVIPPMCHWRQLTDISSWIHYIMHRLDSPFLLDVSIQVFVHVNVYPIAER